MHVPFTKITEIDEPQVRSTVPPTVEDFIVLSFGNSVVEFEATLYEKFLKLTDGLVVTCREFKSYLLNMEERKIVKSTEFLEKKCWTYSGNKHLKSEGSW
ncbi:MAG: hypothetical protein ACFFEV_09365 [Candidatus Thorarchaeota archaeon]